MGVGVSRFQYTHTHTSTGDGSPAMVVRQDATTITLVNEEGYQWTDPLDQWEPISSATVWVGDKQIPVGDLRWAINDEVLVCEPHMLAAEEAELRARGAITMEPRAGGDCVYCLEGKPIQVHPTDFAGRPICGQDFMAGTICTLAPGHEGYHAPACQGCGYDPYVGEECICDD